MDVWSLAPTRSVRQARHDACVDSSDAAVPPTVALVVDRFGNHNVGIVYGWVFAAHMVGAAVAAWAAGVVRDSVGDYAAAFIAAGWIAIIAGLAAMAIQRPQPTDDAPAAQGAGAAAA